MKKNKFMRIMMEMQEAWHLVIQVILVIIVLVALYFSLFMKDSKYWEISMRIIGGNPLVAGITALFLIMIVIYQIRRRYKK